MSNLLTTVIMKTDWRDSTGRMRSLVESDLSTTLAERKQLILRLTAQQGGRAVKGEGDSFWLVFPSVTAAAQVAMMMQEELRLAQTSKGDDRLAIRIAITLGDVLHQEHDIFGEAVNLTARIEGVTPLDEIYLSPAAWLALNKSEVQTTFVNEFVFKGFSEPIKLYKVEREHRTRTITDQVIVFSDVHHYTSFMLSHSIKENEQLLDRLHTLHEQVCKEFGGTFRSNMGDAKFLTFPTAALALAAVERLCVAWDQFRQQHQYPCSMGVGMHKGTMYAFRSFLYSHDINITSILGGLTGTISREDTCVLVTESVQQESVGTEWESRLHEAEIPYERFHSVGGQGKAYQFK
jgi:class 3 adenylate cyclase